MTALKNELSNTRKDGEATLKKTWVDVDKVINEIAALCSRDAAKLEAEELALRTEREDKHGQMVALHELALTTQLEKERLEAEFSERKPRPIVYQHVLATVKRLQD